MAQKLHIDFNCSQRIGLFGPGETGFCKHCQTQVHDLTLLRTTEIKDLISKHQGELCGRVYEDQLEENAKIMSWRLKLRLLRTGFAGVLLLACSRLSAQSRDTVKTEQHISPSAHITSNPSPSTASTDSVSAHGDEVAVMPEEAVKPVRRVQFMRIGRRRFYIGWRFPFFTTRKYLMGKFRH